MHKIKKQLESFHELEDKLWTLEKILTHERTEWSEKKAG